MNLEDFSKPKELEKNSFLWSEARLVIAAVALFLGGVPPLRLFVPLYGLTGTILSLAWIISGLASFYLLYRWYTGDQKLFGGKKQMDTYAFLVSVVSGLNLGLTGLLGYNPGMTISSSYSVFAVVALIYLASAYHLYTRWNESGQKIF